VNGALAGVLAVAYLVLNLAGLADLLRWSADAHVRLPRRASQAVAVARAVAVAVGLLLPIGLVWSLVRPLIAPTPPRQTTPTR
jgi:hypothetical protein